MPFLAKFHDFVSFFRNWKKELEKLKTGGKPSLTMAMIKTHGVHYAKIGIAVAVEVSSLATE